MSACGRPAGGRSRFRCLRPSRRPSRRPGRGPGRLGDGADLGPLLDLQGGALDLLLLELDLPVRRARGRRSGTVTVLGGGPGRMDQERE
jgi:hypothetical protein